MNKELLTFDPASREGFESCLGALAWSEGVFVARASHPRGGGPSPGTGIPQARPGFLLHSLLGLGLRRTACGRRPQCAALCQDSLSCDYGRLLETRPSGEASPLRRVARIPTPVVMDAPWARWRIDSPLEFRVRLLGNAGALGERVTAALTNALSAGIGKGHVPVVLEAGEWQPGSMTFEANGAPLPQRLLLQLRTPLRLVRAKRERRSLSLTDLARDLSFRAAVWAHYHQGLEWPPPWTFIQEEAASARVVEGDIRCVRFVRYSARQRRVIPMIGLLGWAELDGVGPALARLLRLGAVSGAGKGASIGLGRLKVLDLGELGRYGER